jgi:hypothetical protein
MDKLVCLNCNGRVLLTVQGVCLKCCDELGIEVPKFDNPAYKQLKDAFY